VQARNGRAEIVLDRSDGAGRKIVSFASDQTWSVRDEPMPETKASPAVPPNTIVGSITGERRIAGDFDGDGAEDTIVGTHLVLAADPSHPQELPLIASLPPSAVVVAGDISGDHRADLVVFRREEAWRTGRTCSRTSTYREGDADADGDGLDRATEERLKSDPLDADTDHDGLLDGWEVRGEGALDLPALGASPTHKDCFVYVQRYSETDGAALRARDGARGEDLGGAAERQPGRHDRHRAAPDLAAASAARHPGPRLVGPRQRESTQERARPRALHGDQRGGGGQAPSWARWAAAARARSGRASCTSSATSSGSRTRAGRCRECVRPTPR
jgi:hypothetical protein